MQKLSGNSRDKFKKSCSTFHQESKNIGFAFFLSFLRFYRDCTRFSKMTLLFEIRFCRQAPGTFLSFTDRTLACTTHPGKIKSPAMWPLALGAVVPAKILRAGGAGGRGKGGEVTMNSPRVVLSPETGRGWRRRARSAALGGGGRGSACSGEARGIAAQQGVV
jgi:hypothetical protein